MNNDTNLPSAHLDHLNISSPDAQSLSQFYCQILGLSARKVGAYYVCVGPSRCMLISKGDAKAIGFSAFRFGSAEAFSQFVANLESNGVQMISSPSPVFTDDAFGVVDPDGNLSVYGYAYSPEFEALSHGESMTARLQHFAVASDTPESLVDFYSKKLGFVISDRVLDDAGRLHAAFLRTDKEHHALAVFLADRKRLDHHCYEVGEWDLIRDWSDYLATCDVKLQWGPGRHGPGHNLFVMIHDPDGNWIELSAELDTVPDDQLAGEWPHTEKTLNAWGQAFLRS